MIVCICRGISDKDFATEEELLERLLQSDKKCCACIRDMCNGSMCKHPDIQSLPKLGENYESY